MQFGHIEILPFFTTPHCSIPGSMYQCLDIDSILGFEQKWR
jgi:hypothetical protein